MVPLVRLVLKNTIPMHNAAAAANWFPWFLWFFKTLAWGCDFAMKGWDEGGVN